MTRLEFIQKKFSVKSEKELTEEYLLEYAQSKEAGLGTNISIKNILQLLEINKDDIECQPDMNKVYKLLRQAIREDKNFYFAIVEEDKELYSYYIF